MAKLKDSQLVLAVGDLDSNNGNINRRRFDEDEESPLLSDELGREGEFDCFLDPVSLERLPWYSRPSVSHPKYWSFLQL
jgi:hypothetical protein